MTRNNACNSKIRKFIFLRWGCLTAGPLTYGGDTPAFRGITENGDHRLYGQWAPVRNWVKW